MPQSSVLNSISGSVNQRAKDKMLVFLGTTATVILTLKIDDNPRRISGRRFSPSENYFLEGERRRPEIRLRFAG